ncbi:MAG: hypothetical protein IH631_07665 [Candidatus Thorarchaeota archaeon]|nr:hypothetical protein [Candidatus Thorarchaeota archaeon]
MNPEEKWIVDQVLEDFKDETVKFVGKCFEDDEYPQERIIDFNESLDEM